ncbi:hypothetical protein BTHI11S_01708 [Bosea thiooxidans]
MSSRSSSVPASSLRLVKRSVIPVVSAEEVRDSPSVSRRHQLRFGCGAGAGEGAGSGNGNRFRLRNDGDFGFRFRLHGQRSDFDRKGRRRNWVPGPASSATGASASATGAATASSASGFGASTDLSHLFRSRYRLGRLLVASEQPRKEAAFLRFGLAHRHPVYGSAGNAGCPPGRLRPSAFREAGERFCERNALRQLFVSARILVARPFRSNGKRAIAMPWQGRTDQRIRKHRGKTTPSCRCRYSIATP